MATTASGPDVHRDRLPPGPPALADFPPYPDTPDLSVPLPAPHQFRIGIASLGPDDSFCWGLDITVRDGTGKRGLVISQGSNAGTVTSNCGIITHGESGATACAFSC